MSRPKEAAKAARIENAESRIRTHEGTKPADLESAPVDHYGISANENKLI